MMQHIKSLAGELQTRARHTAPLLLMLVLMAWTSPAFAQDTAEKNAFTERVITLVETRPIAQSAALILGGLALYVGGLLIQALRQRHVLAWRTSFKMAGWIVPLITAAVTLIMILNRDKVQLTPMISMSILQLLLPVGAAIHTALIFAPEEEPLEMLLALPRPITWLVFERVLVIGLIYGGIGVLGMGLLATQNRLGDAPQRLGAWLPAMLFLMTFTIYLTTRTRTMSMGLVGGIAVWFISLLFGPLLMPNVSPAGAETPFPINYVQPFLWMINIFAQPLSFPAWEYYTLNRAILLGLSVYWLWSTAKLLGSPESLLLSVQDRQMRRKAPVAVAVSQKRPLRFNSAVVSLSVWWQIAAMWLYETKLHWRRRPLKVITLTMILTVGVVLAISFESVIKVMLPGLSLSDISLDQQMLVKGIAYTRMSFVLLLVLQMLVVPVIMVDAVPLDHQDHMDEMLHSLPLPGWAYLVGKIGGLWWANMSAIALATLILGGVWFLVVGIYDPRPMLDAWILFSAPTILFNNGLAVLIGATQPTRRRAVMLMIGVMFFCFYASGYLADGPLKILQVNPFSVSLLMNVFSQNTQVPVSFQSLFTMPETGEYLAGRALLFLLTALGIGTWWTLRWSGVSLWRLQATGSKGPLLPTQDRQREEKAVL